MMMIDDENIEPIEEMPEFVSVPMIEISCPFVYDEEGSLIESTE